MNSTRIKFAAKVAAMCGAVLSAQLFTMPLKSVSAAPSAAARCVAAKLNASGKRFASIAKCRAKAALAGTSVDAACVAKAEQKFFNAFAKAEASGACAVNGDATTVDTYLGECSSLVGDDVARVCGDGVIAPSEDCDDGDPASGDGCSASCAPETGYDCAGEPSSCLSTCSDGIVASDEQCDDGDASDGDGCASDCVRETGWTCPVGSGPSVCSPICGDGLVRGTELCDDDNIDPDDGCSASCGSEPGWDCSGEPTVCTCGVAASLTPASGIRLPQLLHLDAGASLSGCGQPLQYFWTCTSGTNTGCPDFLLAANANGNTTSAADFQLYEADVVDFSVTVCLAGTSVCATQYRQYSVASL